MDEIVSNVVYDGTRFGYIVHTHQVYSGVNFFGLNGDYLQAAVMSRTIEEPVHSHFHNKIERLVMGTNEVLFLCSGSAIVNFYNQDSEMVASYPIFGGDLVVFIDGGHGIEFLETSKLIEVKQGPYLKDLDKTVFQVKGQ